MIRDALTWVCAGCRESEDHIFMSGRIRQTPAEPDVGNDGRVVSWCLVKTTSAVPGVKPVMTLLVGKRNIEEHRKQGDTRAREVCERSD